ncbi:hypothetical protein C8J57DRAFT_1237084 [Mycena rebaudengoi]|nr:hypothetical protein C8J57DRAFT_1244106 [Mycena rebaudengoi]KAJ7253829.1 hypothetical protein C8J57DRAFT_1237084 [Mycena rebaudengoi]
MVNNRVYLKPTKNTHDRFIRSRLYPASSPSTIIPVHVRANSSDPQADRFACVESIMANTTRQPYIHDVFIQVRHGGSVSCFRAFFKRHRHLPTHPVLQIQGDLLLMRMAATNWDSVVNLRASDRHLTDWVVKQITPTIKDLQRPRKRMPREIFLYKMRR